MAVEFCMGVINSQSCGLGGGFFMTYYDRKSGKGYTLDARETAPSGAITNMSNSDPKLLYVLVLYLLMVVAL